MERKLIGVATKPQALKGQFRIKPSILNIKQFKKIKSVFIDNSEYIVESCSVRDTFVIVKLQGIDTRSPDEIRRDEMLYE